MLVGIGFVALDPGGGRSNDPSFSIAEARQRRTRLRRYQRPEESDIVTNHNPNPDHPPVSEQGSVHDAARPRMRPGNSPSSADRIAGGFRGVLRSMHDRNASEPIRAPDEWGAFVDHWPSGTRFLGGGVAPVVVDANVLRNDVLYACRNQQRTVLVNAANAGAIRLYAASHVVAEVAEHAKRWATESGDVQYGAFRRRWATEYLPLLRVVTDDTLPTLLDPAERCRVDRLAVEDSDDVPSATLSLALGAFFLSGDGPALRAVYGADIDLERHAGWLDILKSGGDAGELDKLIFSAVTFPSAVGASLYGLVRRLVRSSPPWLLMLAGLGIGALGTRVSPETRKNLGSGLSEAAATFACAYEDYHGALVRFGSAVPATPTWEDLARSTDGRRVLARACLHVLARAPTSPMSARELAGALPPLGIGQGEALVRQTLRSGGSFAQPYAGRWQLGQASAPATPNRDEPPSIEN